MNIFKKKKIASEVIPIPEPKDLPTFYTFRGWYPATNYVGGWYAFITREPPNAPPMGQQITVTIFEMEGLSHKGRIKLVRDKIEKVIAETDASVQALGWMDFTKDMYNEMVEQHPMYRAKEGHKTIW